MQMVEIAFKEAHCWLTSRGLRLDQVKNDLIHFTRSTRGRHTGASPSVTIPTNIPGKLKTVEPAKSIRYLGIWLNSQLNFNEHIQKTTTKAMSATYALSILGNSMTTQNHCLCMITGAFHTTNIAVMEIEVSIPPINLWMDYHLEMEALQMSSLPKDHLIICHIYPEQCKHIQPPSPPCYHHTMKQRDTD